MRLSLLVPLHNDGMGRRLQEPQKPRTLLTHQQTLFSLTLALCAPYALVWSEPVAGSPQRFQA